MGDRTIGVGRCKVKQKLSSKYSRMVKCVVACDAALYDRFNWNISIDTYRHIYINIRVSSVQCFFVAKLEYSNIN